MRALSIVFFLSGATGLVYETVWGRELHLIFGTSQFAIATVLAAFMTGLALGGAVAARFVDRIVRPLRAYAALEAVVALYALVFPAVVRALEPAYLGFHASVSPDPVVFGAFQFVLVGLAMLVPTACMGATLPLLTKYVAPRPERAGAAVGWLYGVNTFGAVAGVWLAGFWMLPELGVRASTVTAAVVNLCLAGFALLLDRRGATLAQLDPDAEGIREGWLDAPVGAVLPEPPESGAPAPLAEGGALAEEQIASRRAARMAAPVDPADENMGLPATAPLPRPLLLVAGLAGASSLALEVAWFRVLTLVLGASVYAFSVMLLAFLAGIALGGRLGGPWADRLGGRDRVLAALAGLQGGVAVLSWGAMWLYGELPVLFVQVWPLMADNPELVWPIKCAIAMGLMLPPALLMGATFPVLVRAVTSGDAARPAGAIYAANTVGSILGAFLGGFVLLPALRVTGTVLFCAGLNLAGAAVATASRGVTAARLAGIAAGAAALGLAWASPPPWDPMLMTSGVYKYAQNLDEERVAADAAAEIRRNMIDRYELLYYKEGLSTVITVARNRATGSVWLANNGKIDASTTTDMPTQVLVAHTPFLFTDGRAKNAMLIGLASGITLGALNLHPELERIDVVEIEPAMPEAAALFKKWNHDALSDPRVRLLANDGRNQLLLTEPGTYDVIVAEPSNPWLTGVSNLFTREFFEMGKTRLAPGGVWSQWVQMYGMDGRDLKAVIRTFCEAYPYVLVFSTIRDADMVMVGSERPITMTEAAAAALVEKNAGVEAEMLQIGVVDGYDLLSHFLFDRDVAMALTEGVPLNTDDNLLVEYSAPRNLHRETSGENFLMLLPHAQAPLESVTSADGLLRLAQAYDARDDTVRALIALKEAERREPGRADTLALYQAYQKKLVERIR